MRKKTICAIAVPKIASAATDARACQPGTASGRWTIATGNRRTAAKSIPPVATHGPAAARHVELRVDAREPVGERRQHDRERPHSGKPTTRRVEAGQRGHPGEPERDTDPPDARHGLVGQ